MTAIGATVEGARRTSTAAARACDERRVRPRCFAAQLRRAPAPVCRQRRLVFDRQHVERRRLVDLKYIVFLRCLSK